MDTTFLCFYRPGPHQRLDTLEHALHSAKSDAQRKYTVILNLTALKYKTKSPKNKILRKSAEFNFQKIKSILRTAALPIEE